MASLVMTGSIKKVLSEEGFGFIETKIGDVFFHKSQCASFKMVCKGDFVKFQLKDTNKGKAATHISLGHSSCVKRLVNKLIFTKANEPKQGEVIKRSRIQTDWYSDPNKARESLKSLATKAGCNAVLNIECQKTSIAKGYNYYGTIHCYTADLCLVVDDVAVESSKATNLQKAANVEIENVIEMLDAVAEERREACKPLKDSSVLPMLLTLGVVVWILFIGWR